MGSMKQGLNVLVLAVVVAGVMTTPAVAAAPEIEVLSNRADLVSAGDALVRITLPSGTNVRGVRVYDDARNVTRAFARRPNGHFEGLVTGLSTGRNVLTARVPGRPDVRLTVTNHPNGGPVFTGPQIKPWVCQESAVDEQCNQPPSYRYLYKSSVTGQMQPYDPDSPPSDVAEATTDEGKKVPYVVREETGYQNRDQYRIAALYDPAKDWKPWAPQDGWNRKVLIKHGQSCGIDHQAGEAPDVIDDAALSRGFAVMSTALNHAGHNCNITTQAESLVMAKERIVEQYGPIRYTIGTGCSGGSLTQQQVANAYPGIYQGILPQCSFPDAWSTGQQLAAYNLIRRYVENPSRWAPGVLWDPASIAAIEGHPNHVNSIVLDSLYFTTLGDPTNPCAGVSDSERYDPETNPDGVRCTLADYTVNVVGRRASDGFAGRPLDDVGVQFGLEALRSGQITPAQFVDLNAKIGGADIDAQYQPERVEADQPALRNAYRSGGINRANNLDQVPIIDLRGPDHGAFHDAYRSFAIRARLEREHGHFKNHVIWFGHVPLIGDPNYTTEGLVAMDRWLAAIEADKGGGSLADKVVRNRPSDVVDRCSQIPGVEAVELPGVGRVCENRDVQSRYGTPATVAGESIATDTNKCALKPLRRTDHYPVTFTDAQWSELEKAFPTGVCDWSRPGPSEQDTIPWLTYQDSRGRVVTGGTPLGPPPRSRTVKRDA
jgi:hypothetical protein